MAAQFDVAVVGLGPAGRALASACVARGLQVLAIDAAPEAVWRPTYGVWADEVKGLPATVSRHSVSGPQIRATGVHTLDRTYVVLDNRALQAELSLDGADVVTARLSDPEVSALQSEAGVVIDARGARPTGRGPDQRPDTEPAQTAFGIVVPTAAAAPALEGAPALLMDWRTDWADGSRTAAQAGPASFLYAIPLDTDQVLLEETCLAGQPAYPIAELKARLRRRLLARGVDEAVIDEPLAHETVYIPLRGRNRPAPPGAHALGTAGRGGNLVTGYSVAHALATADRLAGLIADGEEIRTIDPVTPADALREAGLRALLRLTVPGTLALFDAFGALPAERQRAYLARGSSAGDLAAAMWGMFGHLPGFGKRDLIRATLGPGSARRRP